MHKTNDPSPTHKTTDPSPTHKTNNPSPTHKTIDPSPTHFVTNKKLQYACLLTAALFSRLV